MARRTRGPEGVAAGGALDDLGAHVSTAGGVVHAPSRAAALETAVLQLFTKQPSRWAEPNWDEEVPAAFADQRVEHGIRSAASHDSYLINLASPDPELFLRSRRSFSSELERSSRLGLRYVVSHPGNATDGDRMRGIDQDAEAIGQALSETAGSLVVLLEGTAGAGHALGHTLEELALLRERVPLPARSRVAYCLDTCHLWAAGYDLQGDYDGVLARVADTLGLEHLRLLHLNDSVAPLGARRDRHAHIGRGALGAGPFQRLVTDPRLAGIPMVIETPKDEDALAADRANLARLRRWRRAGAD